LCYYFGVMLPTRSLCFALLRAERAVALLERCQPQNMQRELARVQASWRDGAVAAPAFEYAARPSLQEVRAQLDAIAPLMSCGPWGELFADRAAEIAREADLVRDLGTPAFLETARRRYWQPYSAQMTGALQLANGWLAAHVEGTASAGGTQYRSDERAEPNSLVRRIEALVAEHRLPFRVQIVSNLVPVAATGDAVILVAEGRWLSTKETERVAVHEVLAHALPRAKASAPLWQLGTAGATDDEEGRALLLEQRRDLLGEERRLSLALRHVAAQALFDGASYVEVVRALLLRGCDTDLAVMIAARVFRGGGLGREIVYLPALLRVSSGLQAQPELERWFEGGRISLGWAQRLAALSVTTRGPCVLPEPPPQIALPSPASGRSPVVAHEKSAITGQ
jgi:hypothetical protein